MSEVLDQLMLTAELDQETRSRLLEFYRIVSKENEVQNLTRLSSPEDFYLGHLLDAIELNRLNWAEFPAMDLGSGVGVPGIPMAILGKGSWILAESEKNKADYLKRTVDSLDLTKQIEVFAGRAEDYLKNNHAKSIVVRAVGPVERIYSWIRNCSTWNNLILFKGPGWPEEWQRFLDSKWKRELRIEKEYDYTVGTEQKKRKLIFLTRVPRGTFVKQDV